MTTTQLQSTPGLETGPLKKFAQSARRQLIEQVSTKIDQVLSMESAELREKDTAIKELKAQISLSTKEAVIERVAYTWFNRLCALRFMDVNGYTNVRTVSPAEGFTQPEILSEAKQGHIDDSIQGQTVRQRVLDLLSGKIPSSDPQQEAYRLLVVGMCNYFHSIMPFMFETIADYTELLMPDDLLSDGSLLAQVRNALTADACKDVEVIGWLYQFYISEKKDEVFEDLKKNKKISPENVPAATQLFTPHWIVRYVVQNSLGRLWMLNRPNSNLISKMDFYIKPVEEETDFLRISKPEELRICDPACGSGHMLVYAFDLLYSIYEEEGYEATEIPRLILECNLHGIEIDERAGDLAAFALVMKARQKHTRFFKRLIQPKICVLKNVAFDDVSAVSTYLKSIGTTDSITAVKSFLEQLSACSNFGSLLRPLLADANDLRRMLESNDTPGDLFTNSLREKLLQSLQYAEYLSCEYHVVIANPPYMGSKGMNSQLASWVKLHYSDGRPDLFAAFILRISELTLHNGHMGLVTPFVWMFLSSYEKFRRFLLQNASITSLVQLEYNAFAPATIPVCTFTLLKNTRPNARGSYIRLSDFRGADTQGPRTLEAIRNPNCGWFYVAAAKDFQQLPGAAIAYWISNATRNTFTDFPPIGSFASAKQGLITGDNSRFLRYWYEVSTNRIGFGLKSREDALSSNLTWFPFQKGGEFRKWYGNHEYIVDWKNDGAAIRNFFDDKGNLRSRPQSMEYYFRSGITWTSVTITTFNCRLSPPGFIYSEPGPILYSADQKMLTRLAGFLNSKPANYLLQLFAPGMHYNQGHVASLPLVQLADQDDQRLQELVSKLIELAKEDWDSYETSWNFNLHPLLTPERRSLKSLELAYSDLRREWLQRTQHMQSLEQQVNGIFIAAYGLTDELIPGAPLSEITVNCNPHYRYGSDKSPEDLEQLLLLDTIKELTSYVVGCIFGRYSLDKPGLLIGSPDDSAIAQDTPQPSFPMDDDNVVPILDGDWFTDDISERFRRFMRVSFGDDCYEQNLRFIEKVLGKDIRKYFVKDFYTDHVKRYKKRPIYWLFSSPKGAFSALIYLHRYRSDTVSVILNNYLRELRNKLAAHKSHLENISIGSSASAGDKTKAVKEIEALKKTIDELDGYERDVLYPLAMQKMELTLDDGVKTNYTKLGRALRTIPGMSADEE